MIVVSDWYQSLVDDCSAIVTEAVHLSRWELIVGHHTLGKRIVTDEEYQRHANGNKKLCKTLAQDIGQSERTVYYAIQFYTKYPDPEKWPFNKNMSWTKITQLLPDGKWTEGRTFVQRLHSFESTVENLLNKYPDKRDEIVSAFWKIINAPKT